MPLLTDPLAYKSKRHTYRYFVELASHKLDWDGSVHHSQVIDVVIVEPSYEAIKTLVAAAGWLRDYSVVAWWTPLTDEAPF